MSGVRHASMPDELPRPGLVGVGSGVLCAALIALGAFAGTAALAAALIACGLAVAWGWPTLLGLPRPSTSSAVLLVGVIGIGVVEVLAPRSGGLKWLTTALAVSLMAAFLHELVRTDGRPNLTRSIAGAVFGLAVLALGAFHLTAIINFEGAVAIYAACAGVALGLLVDAGLGRSAAHEWALPIGLAISAGVGACLGIIADRPWNVPMLTALIACGLAHALRRVLAFAPRLQDARASAALGAASALFVGVVPYVVLWIFSR